MQRQATLSGATTTITVRYDGDGQRVGKTVATATNSVTTYYVVDELNPTGYAQVLEELTATSAAPTPVVTRVYTYGHARIAQDRLAGSQWVASLYGYDGHNSVRYLTDLDGSVTDTYDYDAFGNLIAQVGSTPNAYLFTGEQYDADLGLYYLRARYHNPDTGRFWSQDSFEGYAGDPASLHKYTYTGNNPVNAYDPSGNISLTETLQAQNIGLKSRGLFATLSGTIGGVVSALDTAIGSNYESSAGELTKSFGIGFAAGFTLGFTGTYLPNAVAVFGSVLGGASVGQAIDASIHDGGVGNWSQVLFRAGTLGLGLVATKTVTAKQLTAAMEMQIAGGQGRLYSNLRPGDKPASADLTPGYQIKAAKLTGVFNFVRLRTGIMRFGKQNSGNGPRNGHIGLSYGAPVKSAGQAYFEEGNLMWFSDDSGHYNQSLSYSEISAMMESAAEDLAEEGFNAIGRFVTIYQK